MTTTIQTALQQKIAAIYQQPFPDLLFEAQTIHRAHHNPKEVQFCTLSSIKTGACPEDCAYCSQSVHNNADLKPEPLMDLAAVLEQAEAAKAGGSTRFCMGLARGARRCPV